MPYSRDLDLAIDNGWLNLAMKALNINTMQVDHTELAQWKKVLPALAERCRTWSHLETCEYTQPGATVPLSLDEIMRCCRNCERTEANVDGGGQLERCGRCLAVWYCSKECQKKNWAEHKPCCKKA
jgi:hypothetical protein